MARTETTNDAVRSGCDEASLPEAALNVTQDTAEKHAAAIAAAKKQVIEIARALARMAAREDDAAERNRAGRTQAEAAAKSAKRRAVPIGNG
jgi:hypothetical protein